VSCATSRCIHRLSYTVNPEGDDLGLVERLIDLMRTIDDCWNKLLEWKNRCVDAAQAGVAGSMNADRDPTTCPAGSIYYNIDPLNPERKAGLGTDAVRVPQELFQILNLALDQMRALAADVDVQADPNVAARTANTAVVAGAVALGRAS
jgi:hypothetical protein